MDFSGSYGKSLRIRKPKNTPVDDCGPPAIEFVNSRSGVQVPVSAPQQKALNPLWVRGFFVVSRHM
jgi:hypothetical protein